MNCSVCGAMIPDGQTVCPSCGTPVQMGQQPMGGYQQPVQPQQQMGGYQQPMQPQQPMGGYQQPMQPQQPMGGYQQPMQQPMGGYQQPMYQPMGAGLGGPQAGGLGAYFGSLSGDIMKILGLAGALIIFITPFFPWAVAKVWGEKAIDGFIGLADSYGIFGFYTFMAFLIGAVLVAIEVSDYVPALYNIKAKLGYNFIWVELGLIAVALLIFILARCHGDVNDIIKLAKSWGSGSHGFGFIGGLIGVIAAAIPRVMKLTGNR